MVIGLVGDTVALNPQQIQQISSFIEQVMRVNQPFKRVALEFRNGEPSEVVVPTPNSSVSFGQNHPLVQVAGLWPKTLTTATLENVCLQEFAPISSLVEKKISRFTTHA